MHNQEFESGFMNSTHEKKQSQGDKIEHCTYSISEISENWMMRITFIN